MASNLNYRVGTPFSVIKRAREWVKEWEDGKREAEEVENVKTGNNFMVLHLSRWHKVIKAHGCQNWCLLKSAEYYKTFIEQ